MFLYGLNKPSFIRPFILTVFLVNSFGTMPMAKADEFLLPAPGVMVHLSPEFNPPILKGIKVHPDNPFRFDFILDVGDGSKPSLREESTRLIKYFLASLTIPEKDLWVNLSPYEKNRIVPGSFGQTQMGRDLLAEDYMLKLITASLIHPEDAIGKKFWKRVYEEAAKKFGTTDIPVNTFNKVWIVPDKAVVYENAKAGTAYVVESSLKVMLEEDYLALAHSVIPHNDTSSIGANIVREIVIPELTKEINENRNFAQLRQVYNSLILATWYKNKIKDSLLTQVYADKKKVEGVGYDQPNEVEFIYRRYLQAFKKGVYNYIKEEPDPLTQQIIPRKYFSGGFGFTGIAGRIDTEKIDDKAMLDLIKSARKSIGSNLGLLKVQIKLFFNEPAPNQFERKINPLFEKYSKLRAGGIVQSKAPDQAMLTNGTRPDFNPGSIFDRLRAAYKTGFKVSMTPENSSQVINFETMEIKPDFVKPDGKPLGRSIKFQGFTGTKIVTMEPYMNGRQVIGGYFMGNKIRGGQTKRYWGWLPMTGELVYLKYFPFKWWHMLYEWYQGPDGDRTVSLAGVPKNVFDPEYGLLKDQCVLPNGELIGHIQQLFIGGNLTDPRMLIHKKGGKVTQLTILAQSEGKEVRSPLKWDGEKADLSYQGSLADMIFPKEHEEWYGGPNGAKTIDLSHKKEMVSLDNGLLMEPFVLPNGKILNKTIKLHMAALNGLKMITLKEDGIVKELRFVGSKGAGEMVEVYLWRGSDGKLVYQVPKDPKMPMIAEAWYGGPEYEKETDLTHETDKVDLIRRILMFRFVLPNGKILGRELYLKFGIGVITSLRMIRYKIEGKVTKVKLIGVNRSREERELYLFWNEEKGTFELSADKAMLTNGKGLNLNSTSIFDQLRAAYKNGTRIFMSPENSEQVFDFDKGEFLPDFIKPDGKPLGRRMKIPSLKGRQSFLMVPYMDGQQVTGGYFIGNKKKGRDNKSYWAWLSNTGEMVYLEDIPFKIWRMIYEWYQGPDGDRTVSLNGIRKEMIDLEFGMLKRDFIMPNGKSLGHSLQLFIGGNLTDPRMLIHKEGGKVTQLTIIAQSEGEEVRSPLKWDDEKADLTCQGSLADMIFPKEYEQWYGGPDGKKTIELSHKKGMVELVHGDLNEPFVLPNGKILNRRLKLHMAGLKNLKMIRLKEDGETKELRFVGTKLGEEMTDLFLWNKNEGALEYQYPKDLKILALTESRYGGVEIEKETDLTKADDVNLINETLSFRFILPNGKKLERAMYLKLGIGILTNLRMIRYKIDGKVTKVQFIGRNRQGTQAERSIDWNEEKGTFDDSGYRAIRQKMVGQNRKVFDFAMTNKMNVHNNGGIDLTPLRVTPRKDTIQKVQFHIDPAGLQQLQNAPGFVPVIINIQPMKDIQVFLGLDKAADNLKN